uniref:Uncharacterized protein n=1 Tax=Physcomitrium patens TaxID=3218 RepID=A0A2K1KA99_PHYPA|nr:hypothetical protein PHYPA_009888 [Physcomitrium patens]
MAVLILIACQTMQGSKKRMMAPKYEEARNGYLYIQIFKHNVAYMPGQSNSRIRSYSKKEGRSRCVVGLLNTLLLQ